MQFEVVFQSMVKNGGILMSLIPDLIIRIFDLICVIVYIRKFLMKEESIQKKIFISLCLISFLDSWNSLFLCLCSQCTTKAGLITVILCEHMIAWMVVISLMIIDRRFSELRYVKNNVLMILAYFPVMGIIWNIGYSYYIGPYITDAEYERLNSHIAIITWLLLIVTNYMLSISYYIITKYQNDRMEGELLSQQYEVERRHYDDIEQMQKSVRGIRHDLGNMLQTAQSLIESGDYDGVSKLMNGIGERLDQSSKVVITGNPAMDSIIGLKLSRAAECGITLEKSIDIPPGLDLNYESMATIFGNLLDNAIEAQADIPEKERIIKIFIKYMNDMLVISIANRCMSDVYMTDDFETEKEDRENHGFGIQNVRNSVEYLGGTIQFERDMNWFNVKIILYGITCT